MSKSVGIMTFYKSINYGAVLQSYALQKLLNDRGYDAEIIQYSDPNRVAQHMSKWKRTLRHVWYNGVKYTLLRDQRWWKMIEFVQKHDRLSKEKYIGSNSLWTDPPVYDCYIAGSDQIWNPAIVGDDESYYLGFAPIESIRISYGASMGSCTYIDKDPEKYRYLIGQLDYVAVREMDLQKKITNELGINAECVLDPTLLLDCNDWSYLVSEHKPVVEGDYILCYYMLGDPVITHAIARIAQALSKKTGFKVINLGLKDINKLRFCKGNLFGQGPLDWLWLFRHAKYVVTNSFHGTAFSINFGKPVYVTVKQNVQTSKTLASRLLSLLQLLEMEDRILFCKDVEQSFDDIVTTDDYDYANAYRLLEVNRTRSLEYLFAALNKEK